MSNIVERLKTRFMRFRSLAGNYAYYGENDAQLDCDTAKELTRLTQALSEAQARLAVSVSVELLQQERRVSDDRQKRLEAAEARLAEGCPDTLPCARLTRMAKAHAEAEAEARRLREALEPFAALLNAVEARYRARGGDPDAFPDTHPSFGVDAYDLPIGAYRRARAALSEPAKEGSDV